MRAFRLSLALFALFLTAFSVADAQAEPLRIGGTLPGEIAWSPDGAHLLVAASDVTRLYRAGEWDAPLRTFPAALRATWVNMRVIELDGQRYEVRTGRAVETPEAPVPPRIDFYQDKASPTGRYLYKSAKDWYDGIEYFELIDRHVVGEELIRLPMNDEAAVERVVFSSDENYLALIYRDWSDSRNRLQLWNLSTQSRLFEVRAHAGSTFKDVRFSLSGDSLIAVEGINGDYGVYGTDSFEYLREWQTSTGELVFTQRGSIPEAITYSPDGQWFTFTPEWLGGDEKLLTIWTGSQRITMPFGYVYETKFNRNGTLLYANTEKGHVLFRLDPRLHTARSLGFLGARPSYEVRAALSDSGQLILTKDGEESKPMLWRAEDLSSIGTFDTQQRLDDTLFSPDDSIIALDHRTFWDAATGEKIFEFDAPVQISPDWSSVAYWEGGALVVTELTDGSEMSRVLVDPDFGKAITIDPLKRWILFVREDELAAYNVSDGKQVFSIPADSNYGQPIITADGSRLIIVSGDGPWTGVTDRITVYNITLPHDVELLSAIDSYSWRGVVSANGTISVDWTRGGPIMPTIYWLDLESGNGLIEWRSLYVNFIGAGFHPVNNWLAVSTWDSTYIIDVTQTIERGGEPVALLGQSHDFAPVANPGFSPAGHFLIVECGSNCFTLTALRDLPETGILIEPEAVELRNVSALAFNAAETMLLSKSSLAAEAHLRLDIEAEPVATLPATGDAVALNADGTLAATVTADGIALWDVNAVRAGDLAPLAVYPVTGLAPTQLTFDAANRLIALEPSGVTVYDPPAPSRQ